MIFDQTFWVGASFLIFVALIGKKVYALAANGLDQRSDQIKNELEEAIRLKEEAQSLLVESQRKQMKIAEESEKIVKHAEEEANRLLTDAAKELDDTINKKIEISMHKLAAYESSVMQQVHNNAIDIIMKSVNSLINDNLDKKTAESLVKDSIANLNNKKFN